MSKKKISDKLLERRKQDLILINSQLPPNKKFNLQEILNMTTDQLRYYRRRNKVLREKKEKYIPRKKKYQLVTQEEIQKMPRTLKYYYENREKILARRKSIKQN